MRDSHRSSAVGWALALVGGLAAAASAAEQFTVNVVNLNTTKSSPFYLAVPKPPLPWFSAASAAWGSCGRGNLWGRSYHWSPNSSVAGAGSQTIYSVSDLVFSAPIGVTSTTVWVNTTIDGSLSGSGNWFGGLSVETSLQGPPITGTVSYTYGGLNSQSGVLTGYSMQGSKNLKFGPFTVSTNVPVTLSIKMDMTASLALGPQECQIQYRHKLAGGPGMNAGGVFDLDPGISANSAEAGIVNNQFLASTDLHLDADKTTVPVGQSLTLWNWNGTPGQPVGLFVTEVNGTPTLVFAGVAATFDADGQWELGPIPYIPSIAGLAIGLTSATQNAYGAVKLSDQLVVTFQ